MPTPRRKKATTAIFCETHSDINFSGFDVAVRQQHLYAVILVCRFFFELQIQCSKFRSASYKLFSRTLYLSYYVRRLTTK